MANLSHTTHYTDVLAYKSPMRFFCLIYLDNKFLSGFSTNSTIIYKVGLNFVQHLYVGEWTDYKKAAHFECFGFRLKVFFEFLLDKLFEIYFE